MAKASTYSDAPSSLQTCCTTCRTVFEVSPELLSSSDTRVRCGECLSIFDALANLRDADGDEADTADAESNTDGNAAASTAGDGEPGDEAGRGGDDTGDLSAELGEADRALAGLGDDTGSLDVTYADFDLFSGDAQLPEVAYLDETADTPEFDFDTVDVDADETFSDTLFVDDVTLAPVPSDAREGGDDGAVAGGVSSSVDGGRDVDGDPDFVDDDDTVEPPVFRYRDADATDADGTDADAVPVDALSDDALATSFGATDAGGAPAAPYVPPPPTRSGGSWALRTLMLLMFAALIVALYAYRGRGSLHNDPLARPVLVAGCRVIGCDVPSRVDLTALKLVDKKVFTHPNTDDALVINVAFRNAAAFDQRYPVLVVRLRDRIGRSVAERDFAPSDYLDTWRAGDTLAAGRRLDISLEVDDPGDGADSYEFEFREANG